MDALELTDDAILNAYQGGRSCTSLAKISGRMLCDVHQTIAAAAARRGVTLRRRLSSVPILSIPEELCDDYRRYRKSVGEIAVILNRRLYTVKRHFILRGINRNKNDKPLNKSERMYAAFKSGKTMKEISEEFETKIQYVATAISIGRRKDPNAIHPQRKRCERRNALIFDDYQAGCLSRTLAVKYGIARQRILQIVHYEAKQRNVALRQRLSGRRVRTWSIPGELCDDYRRYRKSIKDLAVILNQSRAVVSNYMRDYKIIRDKNDKPPTKSELIYEAFKNGKNLKELARDFGVSTSYAGVAVQRCRNKDPNPYYRNKRLERSPS